MEMIKFLLDNLLGPILEKDLEWVNGIVGDQQQQRQQLRSSNEEEQPRKNDKQKGTEEDSNQTQGSRHKLEEAPGASGDAILDANGPKLVEGVRIWIAVYVVLGNMNLPHAPLYVSLMVKVAIMAFSFYIFWTHFLGRYLDERVINAHNTNPIFLLVTILAAFFSTLNVLIIFYMNLFKLSPLLKILTTPKLCFVDQRTQHVFGSSTIKYMLVFFAYQTLLNRMFFQASLEEFFQGFKLSEFLLELYSTTVIIHYTIGMCLSDIYIRACFGAWLLALKSNLECRSVRFERLSKRLDRTAQPIDNQGPHLEQGHIWLGLGSRGASGRSIDGLFQKSYSFVSMNEVQKRLNTMDDHLEVWRNVISTSLVLNTISGFMSIGSLLMISYSLFTKSANYYHATISFMTTVNFGLLIMVCYLGDSFISYSLSNFVQTVEDEYFLQDPQQGVDELEQLDWLNERQLGVNRATATAIVTARNCNRSKRREPPATADSLTSTQTESRTPSSQLLLIKKSDVIFCREFLEQFDSHLATPWSKLTLKSHLSMTGTFVTLIAAQIIFDSEH